MDDRSALLMNGYQQQHPKQWWKHIRSDQRVLKAQDKVLVGGWCSRGGRPLTENLTKTTGAAETAKAAEKHCGFLPAVLSSWITHRNS